MGLLIFLVVLIPTPQPSADTLMNFSRLSKAFGHEIALVDRNGTVREGRLVATTVDAATMEFASGTQVFTRDEITSVTRLKDSTRDGLIKGLLAGALLSAYVMGQLGADGSGGMFLRATAAYGVMGWALDAANKNRQPVYRAPAKGAAVKLTLRF
jgi:hypothetical protein